MTDERGAAPGGGDAGPGEPASLRLAVVPGVTVGRWAKVWAERRPRVPLVVLPTPEAQQRAVLGRGADAALVRLPVDREGLSLIPLYREQPVVVVPTEHLLTAADDVRLPDLTDEAVLHRPEAPPQWQELTRAAGLAWTAVPAADAVALVAAGAGVLLVPMSVARLHHRRDVTFRPVVDLPESEVGLAWPEDRTTPLVEELIGVVRGRTERSSRGGATPPQSDASRGGRAARRAAPPGARDRTPPRGRRRGRR